MWDHYKITIKTNFGTLKSMKKNNWVNNIFLEKNFPTCREILVFQGNFFPILSSQILEIFGVYWPLYEAPLAV